jgi:hypothetical protein
MNQIGSAGHLTRLLAATMATAALMPAVALGVRAAASPPTPAPPASTTTHGRLPHGGPPWG